uniref:Uncharacterized protein n=1 Tax=Schistosoma japonicum TaxID=6182 RepID=Q5BR16_SCHJA|nr:unknown [Schistosoma japonicum]
MFKVTYASYFTVKMPLVISFIRLLKLYIWL